MKNHVTIEPSVIAVLEAGELRDGKYFLPGQLDRKMYEAVNKVLVLMGGKWNKSAKSHVFDRNPADVLENTIRTGCIFDEKKAFQFFETPEHAVDRMMDLAEVKDGDLALEPSAGRGAIARRLRAFTSRVVAIELNPRMAEGLRTHNPSYAVGCADFLTLTYETGFDKIVMNPPFSLQQDIKHIRHASKLLAPGGKLVAICGNGPRQKDALRPLARTWEELPRGTFSDTEVSTVMLTICN